MASYLRARGIDSRWYHLDVRDSDSATFFYYMSRGAGEAQSPALPLFTPEYHDELPSFARRFFRTLFESLSPWFVLVLDDYHEVTPQSALHGVIESAISETPPDGCVIVISRSEPPPSMARLRANRKLEVVGWDELRLTRQESDAIVEQWDDTCGELAREQIYEKTQGWAAGLVLMLDQIVTEGRVAAVPNLSSRQLVFDYLAGEVLQGFDTPTRELLLKTALLNEMSPSIAASLARNRGQAKSSTDFIASITWWGCNKAAVNPSTDITPCLRTRCALVPKWSSMRMNGGRCANGRARCSSRRVPMTIS